MGATQSQPVGVAPTMALTDVAIRKAKPSTGTIRLFDGGGLYLEVVPSGGPVRRRPSSRCDASPVHEFSRGFQTIRSPAMSSGRRLLIQRAARADRLWTRRSSTSTPLIHRLAPSCCGQLRSHLGSGADRPRDNSSTRPRRRRAGADGAAEASMGSKRGPRSSASGEFQRSATWRNGSSRILTAQARPQTWPRRAAHRSRG